MDVRTSVTGVNNTIWTNLQFFLQLYDAGYFSVASRDAKNGLDFAGGTVFKLRAKNVIRGHNTFQRRLHNLSGRSRENVKIEMIARYALIQNPVKKMELFFQRNALARLDQVLTANMAELRIVQQK